MAKKDRGTNGRADPVRAAEQALVEAKATLAATTEEIQAREAEVVRLREEIGADPDGRDSETKAMRCLVVESRLSHLHRQRPSQEAAVTQAEAAVTQAQAAKAQVEIDMTNAALDSLNTDIGRALTVLLDLIGQHEALVTSRDLVAKEHKLPSPGRRRFLFARHLLTSAACEVLRTRLDVRLAEGGIREQRAEPEMNILSGITTALPPM